MDNLKQKVKNCSALQLACEYSRILSLVEEGNPKLITSSDAKKLLYIEEELQAKLYKFLPGLPKIELSQQTVPGESAFNEILGSYFKRKSNTKEHLSGKQIRFFIKVINNLNVTIASIPVMASDKTEALEIAEEQSQKLGSGKLKFKIS